MEGVKKFLYYLAFPIIVIGLVIGFIMEAISKGANETIDKAEKKDGDLSAKQQEAELKADLAVSKAEEIENKIEAIEDDVDWHKDLE